MSHARAYSIKDRPSKENEKELKKQLLGSINLMEKKKILKAQLHQWNKWRKRGIN